MSFNVIPGRFGVEPDPATVKELRDLADAMEAGHVTDVVAAFVQNEEYRFTIGAGLQKSLVLATLLQSVIIDRFKK